jgi:hypothetical protein
MKSGKVYSLYTYKNAWDEEKKRSYREPGSTKIVGRILGGGKVGEIKWTDDFIDSIPSLDAFNAHRLEDGTIEFTTYEKEMQISVNEALNAKRYSAGASWVFDNLIADTPLSKALNRTFGAYNVNKKILSLAYFLNISESNAMLRYEPFANRYRLPWHKPLTSSAITRIFQRITPEKIDKFISILNELTMERDSNDYSCKYWALDSTSISTYSQKLAKSAFGYNKDGDDTPQINVLMVVNQKTGEPVYYRTYNGNIPDISTIKNMLQEKARINLNSNAVFVTDKGYSSISNIHRFYQNKTSFLMNLRTSFSMCRNIIESVQTELYDPISYNEDIDCHVTTTEFNWSYPVNFKTNCKKRNPREKEPIFVHIYISSCLYFMNQFIILAFNHLPLHAGKQSIKFGELRIFCISGTINQAQKIHYRKFFRRYSCQKFTRAVLTYHRFDQIQLHQYHHHHPPHIHPPPHPHIHSHICRTPHP